MADSKTGNFSAARPGGNHGQGKQAENQQAGKATASHAQSRQAFFGDDGGRETKEQRPHSCSPFPVAL